MPAVTTSQALTLKNIRAIIYGSPGIGKTLSTVTMSAKCPTAYTHVRNAAVKTAAPLITLDDMLWISFDAGCTTGFAEQGFDVPEIPLANVQPLDLIKELDATAKIVADRVRSGVTKVVVIDTLSALNEMLQYRAKVINNLDKYALYGEMLENHRRFNGPIKALDCHVLYLCHAKATAESDEPSAIRRLKAAGGAVILPDVTGQSLQHYRRDASFIFPVVRQTRPSDGKPCDGHWFLTKHAEFEAKTRLNAPDVIPADWRPLLARVAKGELVKEGV